MITQRLTAVCAALLASAVLAACGGSDDSNTQGTAGATAPAATTTTGTDTSGETTETGGETTETQASAEGEQVFAENCATCHTLAAADADGQVGPNLDDLKPSESTVETTVKNGRGAMPSFEGQLSEDQIKAVAAFVSSSAGQG